MDRQQLPRTAFIDPNGGNEREVEALARQVLKRLLGHLSHSNGSPLTSPIELQDLVNIPETAIDESLLLEQLEQILANSMNPYSPRYIGHMDSMPTVMSVLGDLVASAINNNMLSVEMSPIFSRLEPLLLEQFATLFGLGDLAGGVLVSGGTLANLQALAVARNVMFQALQRGIFNLDKQPVLFASEMAHTSLQKAAMLLGLGTSALTLRRPVMRRGFLVQRPIIT